MEKSIRKNKPRAKINKKEIILFSKFIDISKPLEIVGAYDKLHSAKFVVDIRWIMDQYDEIFPD